MKINKKKQNKKNKKNKKIEWATPTLPQNILPIGEIVFEDKNIYIHQKVYREIHKFAANNTENEHGGILVGRVLNEMGKENTIIEGFIEAKNNVATPTTLTFTHETWEYFHSEINKKYKDKKIVGWIHTHPNFGIFLSENDRFIQQNFFMDLNQVAYVVDPIQNDEGFFFWVDEKLKRCPGFYLFDKNGVKLRQPTITTEDDFVVTYKRNKLPKILLIVMALVIIANVIFMVNKSSQIKKLQNENLEIKSQLYQMQMVINNQGMIMLQNFPLQIQENQNTNESKTKPKDKTNKSEEQYIEKEIINKDEKEIKNPTNKGNNGGNE